MRLIFSAISFAKVETVVPSTCVPLYSWCVILGSMFILISASYCGAGSFAGSSMCFAIFFAYKFV